MKHKSLIFFIPCTILAISIKPSVALVSSGDIGGIETLLSCTKTDCPANTITLITLNQELGEDTCTSYTKECYTNGTETFVFKKCNLCKTPYTKTSTTYERYCGFTTPFEVCGCVCSNCSDVSWAAYGTGYQRYVTKSCNCDGSTATCNSTYSYRCAAGYYGSSTNGTSGCTKCPAATGVYTDSARTSLVNTTSTDGTASITGCNIPSGTYYDTTGTFKLTSKCNYTE